VAIVSLLTTDKYFFKPLLITLHCSWMITYDLKVSQWEYTVKSWLSTVNFELKANMTETASVSIVNGWCDECCVCMLYLYTKLSSVPA
jgi:hypothetical protein